MKEEKIQAKVLAERGGGILGKKASFIGGAAFIHLGEGN